MRKGYNPSLSQFSVALKNLPPHYVEEEIKDMFAKAFPLGDIKVADIQPTYDIATYMKYFKELAHLRKQKKEIQQYRDGRKSCALRCKGERALKTLKENVYKREQEVLTELGQCVDSKVNDLQKTDMAFVTLESLQNKHYIMSEAYNKKQCCFRFRNATIRGNIIQITHAADPSEVNWENLSIKEEMQKCRRVIIWVVSLLMVGACLGINYAIKYWQQLIKAGDQTTQEFQLIVLNCLSLTSIFFTNVVIKKVIFTALSKWAKFYTQTKYQKYHTFRVLTLMVLNTTLVPFIVYSQPHQYFMVGGLLNEVILVIVLISFGTALAHFFDVLYIYKRMKQCLLRRQLRSPKKYSGFVNQWEANLIFEGQEPYLTDIYPPLIIPFVVVAFYMPLFPLGGPIAALGYFFSHLIFMFLLLRRWKKAPDQTQELAIFYLNILLWIPLIYACSNFYFTIMVHSVLEEQSDPAVFIVAFVGLTAVFLLYLLKLCCRMDFTQRNKRCRVLSGFFTRKYETQMSAAELQELKRKKCSKARAKKYREQNPVFRNENNLLEGILSYGVELLAKEDPQNKVTFDAKSVFEDIKKHQRGPKPKKQIWRV